MASSRIDKTYFALVRMLPCVKCGTGQSIVAHIRKGTDGGTGLKPSPWFVLPLCDDCHKEQHRVGEITFWGGIDGVYKAIDWALRLYESRDDIFKAQRVIVQARKDLF